jgi:hypothetical protein
MTNLINFSDTLLSDTYKDAYGFRPRHYKEFWTEEELGLEYDRLQVVINSVMAEEAAAHKAALAAFNTLIEETIALGAADRKTAIRWLMDGENVNNTYRQEVEHFFWSHGLSFEMIDKLTNEFALYYLGA